MKQETKQLQLNEMAFTGGEWKVQKLRNLFALKTDLLIVDKGNIIISAVNAIRGGAEANAALIANAPAMYEALKETIEIFPLVCDSNKDDPDTYDFYIKAKAILNRINNK